MVQSLGRLCYLVGERVAKGEKLVQGGRRFGLSLAGQGESPRMLLSGWGQDQTCFGKPTLAAVGGQRRGGMKGGRAVGQDQSGAVDSRRASANEGLGCGIHSDGGKTQGGSGLTGASDWLDGVAGSK